VSDCLQQLNFPNPDVVFWHSRESHILSLNQVSRGHWNNSEFIWRQ
jgi:hypothetical protein